jgi:hypothetical protein
MLLNINMPKPYRAGSEADLEGIQKFVDFLHEACATFEAEEALKFIRKCAKEREEFLLK